MSCKIKFDGAVKMEDTGGMKQLMTLTDPVSATAAPAPVVQAADELQGCACRWRGEQIVSQCEVHAAWRETLHEQAEERRANRASAAQLTAATAALAMCDRIVDQYDSVQFGVDFSALGGSLRRALASPSPAAGNGGDAVRLDWLDADGAECVFHLGRTWYTRASYGQPYRRRANLRDAIDAARAAQKGAEQ